MNIEKSVAFLNTNNEQPKKKFNKKFIFMNIKQIKILWDKVNQDTKVLYTENYKTLLKEIKRDKLMERHLM